MPKFGDKSLQELNTCDIEIQRVLHEAIKVTDFTVLKGYRGEDEQNLAFASGNSKLKYPDSKHNKQPSQAVDIAPYPIDWNDIGRFQFLAGVVLGIASQMGIELEWGGNWGFKDYPHFQKRK